MYSVASTAGYFVTRKLANRNRAHRRGGKKSLVIDPSTYITGKEIKINVSGAMFHIHESYLNQHPDTLLGSAERNYFYDEDAGEYFFDRDPYMFRFIHKYYKTGKLHFSDNDCHESFNDEMEFFRINPDEVAPCCSDSYEIQMIQKLEKEKKVEVIKRIPPQNFRELCWEFTEEPQICLSATVFYYISCLIITLSVALNSAETVPCNTFKINGTVISERCGEVHDEIFFTIDSTCVGFFTLEYLLRLYGTPNRLKFVKGFMSVVDILSILPYFIDLTLALLSVENNASVTSSLVALRSLRIFRIFKLARHSKRLRDLSSSIKNSASELGFIVFMYFIVVIVFASIIYYAENMGGESTKIDSIPEAIWYTVVTTTTLG